MRPFLSACLALILSIAVGYNTALARDGGGGNYGGGHHYDGGHGHSDHHHSGWGHGDGWGHRGNYSSFSLGFYSPGFGPRFYDGFYPNYGRFGGYDPYYSYPPAVVTVPVPVTPPIYIQQSPPVSQHLQAGYWYYCRNPEGYYPYIKECLQTWQQVEPRPPVNH